MKPEKGLKTENRRMKRARLIRDGMSWRRACLESGYSLSVANRGPRGYSEGRPGVVKDFERAAAEAVWKPETFRKIVTHRLATSVIEGRPSNVAREAELLGKQKDVDMFVRTEGGNTTNILAVLADPDGGGILEKATAALDNYLSCSWCGEENIGNAESLQRHALVCSKRPINAAPQIQNSVEAVAK